MSGKCGCKEFNCMNKKPNGECTETRTDCSYKIPPTQERSNDLIGRSEHCEHEVDAAGNQGESSEATTRAIGAASERLVIALPEGLRRVESGSIQFGDDWPGYFMRGDDAFNIAANLHIAMDAIKATNNLIVVMTLQDAIDRLLSCSAGRP